MCSAAHGCKGTFNLPPRSAFTLSLTAITVVSRT